MSPRTASRASPRGSSRSNGVAALDWEVIVEIDGMRAGGRATPPPVHGKAVKAGKRRISEEQLAEQLTSFIPDHLGFSPTPVDLIKGVKNHTPGRVAPPGGDHRLRRRRPPRLPRHRLSVVHGRARPDQPRLGLRRDDRPAPPAHGQPRHRLDRASRLCRRLGAVHALVLRRRRAVRRGLRRPHLLVRAGGRRRLHHRQRGRLRLRRGGARPPHRRDHRLDGRPRL